MPGDQSESHTRSHLWDRLVLISFVVGMLSAAGLLTLHYWPAGKVERTERVVQEVKIFQPPPPEPEKKVVEKEVEEVIEEKPSEMPSEAPPAPSDLGAGLDQNADAGSDSFHLAAGRGGGLFGRGGSDGGWGALIALHITKALQQDEHTRNAKGLVWVTVDIDTSGKFTSASLLSSTGDAELDEAIRKVLMTLPPLGRPRPPGIKSLTQMSINIKRADG